MENNENRAELSIRRPGETAPGVPPSAFPSFWLGHVLSTVRTDGTTISVGCKDIVLYPDNGHVTIEFSRKKTARVGPADLRSIAEALLVAAGKAEALGADAEQAQAEAEKG